MAEENRKPKTESQKPTAEAWGRRAFPERAARVCLSCVALGFGIGVRLVHADQPAGSTQPTAGDDGQKELSKKLIGGGGSEEKDVMAVILSLMGHSQERLKNDFDPGAQTQAVQKDILKQLDAAIASARKQKRSSNA